MHYQTKTIDEIISLRKQLDKLLPLKERANSRLKKKFRLEFNYNSNHLEGNTLTLGQTQLLLLHDKSSGDASISDIEEMKAHDIALSQVEKLVQDNERPLTEQFICELNQLILVKPFWKDSIDPNGTPTRKRIEIGKYKSLPNHVLLRNGETHQYASPEETPLLMGELISWYRDHLNDMHPVQLAAEFHYRFVCIHPFDDGNGRVARLIMNYILLKNNYPLVVIKSEDKEGYLTALQKADAGDKFELIEYIEKQQIWSLQLSIKAANGEDIEEYDDVEKRIEILKREKLTKSKIYKTPKVSHEVFAHVNNEIWKPMTKFLTKFDDFFAESKLQNKVDLFLVKEMKSTAGFFSLMTNSESKKYEVFGYDLEEKNVSQISWLNKFLALKSASKKIDFEIECNLWLKESSYQLSLKVANTDSNDSLENEEVLFKEEYEYKTLLMKDAIDEIIKSVSNHLIEKISLKD